MDKITDEELAKVQAFVTEFNTLKMQIGDASLAQCNLVTQVDSLKEEYNTYELELMKKYGEDAILNVQTGAITRKEEQQE
tara:strand:+ start:395 stop:634 length:240 start_codon:yes stop_codon:yes gene_type:complete